MAAIDHGLFSFVDVHHNEWPIVLITNPKHPLYRIPSRENGRLQLDSTHIRVLAFSLDEIVECQIRLDQRSWETCTAVNRNLFVRPWTPQEFDDGRVHDIEVLVRDASGRSKQVRQPFTHGDTGDDIQFSTLARLALMLNTATIFRALFWTMTFICVVPMCAFRVWHHLVSSTYIFCGNWQ